MLKWKKGKICLPFLGRDAILTSAGFKTSMFFADMAELADALDLGSSVNRRAGSTPVIRSVFGKP